MEKKYLLLALISLTGAVLEIKPAASSAPCSSIFSYFDSLKGFLSENKKPLYAAATGAGLSLGAAYLYHRITQQKQTKSSDSYYSSESYQKLIDTDQPRHIPLAIFLDNSEAFKNKGAVLGDLDNTISIVLNTHMPITIITTPLILRNYLLTWQHEFTQKFNMYSLMSKGLDFVLLTPKSFNNSSNENFNLEGATSLSGDITSIINSLEEHMEYKNDVVFDAELLGNLFINKANITWDIYILGHGQRDPDVTVGISPELLMKLLTVFNTQIHTGTVLLNSCFLSGPNSDLTITTKNTARYIQPLSYILMINGVFDDVVILGLPERKEILTNYFNHAVKVDKGKSLSRMLESLTTLHALNPDFVQVLLPNQTAYQTFSTGNDLTRIGIVEQQKSIRNRQPINISGMFALVYPEKISTPLHVHAKPATPTCCGIKRRLLPDLIKNKNKFAYPRLVFLREEQGKQPIFKQDIGDIVVVPHPASNAAEYGVIKSIIDMFKREEGSFSEKKQQQIYYIDSISGPNDLASYLVNDSSKRIALPDEAYTTITQAGDITLSHIKLHFFATIKHSYYATLEFDCGHYRYSFLINRNKSFEPSEIIWTAHTLSNDATTSSFSHTPCGIPLLVSNVAQKLTTNRCHLIMTNIKEGLLTIDELRNTIHNEKDLVLAINQILIPLVQTDYTVDEIKIICSREWMQQDVLSDRLQRALLNLFAQLIVRDAFSLDEVIDLTQINGIKKDILVKELLIPIIMNNKHGERIAHIARSLIGEVDIEIVLPLYEELVIKRLVCLEDALSILTPSIAMPSLVYRLIAENHVTFFDEVRRCVLEFLKTATPEEFRSISGLRDLMLQKNIFNNQDILNMHQRAADLDIFDYYIHDSVQLRGLTPYKQP